MKKIIFQKMKGFDIAKWLNSTIILALAGGKSLLLCENINLLKTENEKTWNDCWQILRKQ